MRTTTRKALPLPDITDAGSSTFPVGTGPRATTVDGVVRDVQGILAQLLDYYADVGFDEVITGRWEFQQGILADKGSVTMCINNTGAARAAGDVVMFDPAVDNSIVLPNMAALPAAKVGIVAEAIAIGALGRVTLVGVTQVLVTAGTTRGQYLQTQNASAIAVGSSILTGAAFGIALTAPNVSNFVTAIVHAGGGGGGLEVKTTDSILDVSGVQVLQFPPNSLTNNGGQNLTVNFGSSLLRVETYNNQTGTTVVINAIPDTILEVTKNGLALQIGTDVTVVAATRTLTFTTALAADNIQILYITTNQFNPSTAPYIQEFDPAGGATTVTLANIPTVIMNVIRNGVPQSQAKGDWSWNAGTGVVTFSDAFVAGDHVIVIYAQNFGGGNASSVNNLPAVPASAPAANSLVATDANGRFPASTMPTTTGFHEEFLPANAATTVVLSQTPGLILFVTRNGVVQSSADNDYTLAGNTLTFTDAFDGTTRVAVGYILGTNIGAANTVGGFSASSAAVATPGTLVATDATTGKLPGSILTGFANQLVNGGFEIWQRGNGPFTATGSGTTGIDRWYVQVSGTGAATFQKDTTHQSLLSSACVAVTVTAADGTDINFVMVETMNMNEDSRFRGQTITLSFHCHASAAGQTVKPYMQNPGGPQIHTFGPATVVGVADQIITWTVVFPNNANAVYFGLAFESVATFYVDNTMFVVGSTVIDYIPLAPADDLARALRYYETPLGATNTSMVFYLYGPAGGAVGLALPFHTQKAIAPTVTKVGTWGVGNSGQPSILASNLDAVSLVATAIALGTAQFGTNAAGAGLTVEANP